MTEICPEKGGHNFVIYTQLNLYTNTVFAAPTRSELRGNVFKSGVTPDITEKLTEFL